MKFLFGLVLIYSYCVIHAQPGKIDSSIIARPLFHFQPEYAFDVPVDAVAWQKQKPGLHVSFVSTDEAYFRTEVPGVTNESLSWQETGWKGERLNAMILVWSPDTINQVHFILNDLLRSINNDHELKKEKLKGDIQKGKRIIEELSDQLK